MNFVLRTAHAEEKKKGGHTNPDVRTYDNIYMKNRRCITHVGLASLAQLQVHTCTFSTSLCPEGSTTATDA